MTEKQALYGSIMHWVDNTEAVLNKKAANISWRNCPLCIRHNLCGTAGCVISIYSSAELCYQTPYTFLVINPLSVIDCEMELEFLMLIWMSEGYEVDKDGLPIL